MSLKNLKTLAKLKRISAFTPETLISDFGLYQSAIIDLRPSVILEDEEPRVDVNPDVSFLQTFLMSKTPLLLSCPSCLREMAFKPKDWENPRNIENTSQSVAPKSGSGSSRMVPPLGGQSIHHNVFDITNPLFRMDKTTLMVLNSNDLEQIKKQTVKDQLIDDCISRCRDFLSENASEIRRDFMCTLDASHRLFVNFRIYDPIEPSDIEEYGNLVCESENESTQAYEYLKKCLIIQKVGQYPSIADMQMYDVEKYKTVLGRNSYPDLTRAIGLYADGIGCGSFLYLRRIIERLVEEAHQKVRTTTDGWNEEVYDKSRFNERIQMIEDAGIIIIPETLKDVKNKIYGVLSKGVHESTDNECMELFPYIQFVIEQILDDRIRKKELDQKLATLKKRLQSVK